MKKKIINILLMLMCFLPVSILAEEINVTNASELAVALGLSSDCVSGNKVTLNKSITKFNTGLDVIEIFNKENTNTDIILDLNGNKIDNLETVRLNNNENGTCHVKIVDSGTTGQINGTSFGLNSLGSNLEISGGTFINTNETIVSVFIGTASINNGKFYSYGADSMFYTEGDGVLNIKNGKFFCSNGLVYSSSISKSVIENGTYFNNSTRNFMFVVESGATIEVKGGTYYLKNGLVAKTPSEDSLSSINISNAEVNGYDTMKWEGNITQTSVRNVYHNSSAYEIDFNDAQKEISNETNQTKIETKNETKIETKNETKIETKNETKIETKNETKNATKNETKNETGNNPDTGAFITMIPIMLVAIALVILSLSKKKKVFMN